MPGSNRCWAGSGRNSGRRAWCWDLPRWLTLPGIGEGLRFYLVPDFGKVNAGVIAAALGQVFFSLSLGGTFHVTYGSYLSHTTDLRRSAWGMAIGDTLAAVFAALIIVPAAAAFS